MNGIEFLLLLALLAAPCVAALRVGRASVASAPKITKQRGKSPLPLPHSLPEEPDDLVDLGRVEARVRRSSLTKVETIVTVHPEEAAAVLRGWLHG